VFFGSGCRAVIGGHLGQIGTRIDDHTAAVGIHHEDAFRMGTKGVGLVPALLGDGGDERPGADEILGGLSARVASRQNHSYDAYASDRVILIGLALASKDSTKLALSNQYLSYEPYGLMLRRGDADFRLAVNRALSQLYRSGQIYPIYERWFGAVDRASPLLQSMYLLHGLPE
jgi:hypothetical protein